MDILVWVLLGVGTLLLYSAFKGKSPIEIVTSHLGINYTPPAKSSP